MKIWIKELRTALVATLALAFILCGLYPAAVWILAQTLFPAKSAGSLVVRHDKILGSSLIGQGFSGPRYFHPRPSAAGNGYDAARSGGSNLGPTSRALVDAVRRRVTDYRTENNLPPSFAVPADAVTASASGLDPHISLENARLQVARVAKARGMSERAVQNLVKVYTQGRELGILGEPGVNVLMLNLALDGMSR